jgi:hypothetical protein
MTICLTDSNLQRTLMMCRTFHAPLSLVLVLALSHVGSAQQIPGEAQTFFETMAGKWKAESTADGRTTIADFRAELTPNKEGVIWHWEGTNPLTGEKATAVGLMGWDGRRKKIIENMVSSNGAVFRSTWSGSSDRWTCKGSGSRFADGKYDATTSERVVEWESDDQFVIVAKMRLKSGEAQDEVKSVFTRRK